MVGELLLCHLRPSRTARRSHKGHLFGHLVQEHVGLFYGTKVRPNSNLLHAGKAKLGKGVAQLAHVSLAAKLSDERRRHDGNHLVAANNGEDHLRDLALVGNGAKRAVYEALSARDALLVIDLGAAVLVGANGMHATRVGAGASVVMYCVIGARALAHTAFDALLLVDDRALLMEGDGLLATDLATRVRKAALAHVGNHVHVVLAGVAGELYDIDERRVVVGIGNGGIGKTFAHANRAIDAP